MKPCFGEKHDLALRNIKKKWKMPVREWKAAPTKRRTPAHMEYLTFPGRPQSA